jgi:hypothetical protein
MNTFARRVLGAAVLDRRTYEEVEADARATGQAVGVVVLASVAGGIGLLGLGAQTLQSLVAGIVGSLIGWMASQRQGAPACFGRRPIAVLDTQLRREPRMHLDVRLGVLFDERTDPRVCVPDRD